MDKLLKSYTAGKWHNQAQTIWLFGFNSLPTLHSAAKIEEGGI